jgi:hypothetical protein
MASRGRRVEPEVHRVEGEAPVAVGDRQAQVAQLHATNWSTDVRRPEAQNLPVRIRSEVPAMNRI